MASYRHPKLYDPVTLKSIRDTFHEIIDELDGHNAFPVVDQMKADIIERLLHLATHDIPQDDWKETVLSTLPDR